jgi:tryptophan-rich sensory protein
MNRQPLDICNPRGQLPVKMDVPARRKSHMPWVTNRQQPTSRPPETKDRIICGLSYLSMGMIGLIAYLALQGKGQSRFFMFHFYQSILAGIFIMLIGWGFGGFMDVMTGLFSAVPGAAMTLQLIMIGFTFVKYGLYLVLLYGAVTAFMGKQAEIPGVAKIVYQQLR